MFSILFQYHQNIKTCTSKHKTGKHTRANVNNPIKYIVPCTFFFFFMDKYKISFNGMKIIIIKKTFDVLLQNISRKMFGCKYLKIF